MKTKCQGKPWPTKASHGQPANQHNTTQHNTQHNTTQQPTTTTTTTSTFGDCTCGYHQWWSQPRSRVSRADFFDALDLLLVLDVAVFCEKCRTCSSCRWSQRPCDRCNDQIQQFPDREQLRCHKWRCLGCSSRQWLNVPEIVQRQISASSFWREGRCRVAVITVGERRCFHALTQWRYRVCSSSRWLTSL